MKIDACVALCSRLYLYASSFEDASWNLAALSSDGRPVPFLGPATLQGAELTLDGLRVGLLCLSLPELGIGALDRQMIALRLVAPGFTDVLFAGSVGSIFDDEAPRRIIDQALRRPETAKLLPPLIHAFIASSAPRISREPDALYIDTRVVGQGAQVIDGWIANFAYRDVAIITGDFRAGATRHECRLVERKDVTADLASRGMSVDGGHYHGFSAILPRFGVASEPLFVISRTPGGFELMGPLENTLQHDPGKALEIASARHVSRQAATIVRAARQIHMVLTGCGSAAASVKGSRILGPETEPTISIVVCHYGSTFWFASCLQQQHGFPDSIEVIHVCDDPAIAAEMTDELDRQSDRLTCPTRLVFMASNQGYAAANNAGVAAARGEVVVLMNSDIWLDNPIALFEAADWLARNPADVVGFTLRFDDDSIQHDGIELMREPAFGNLYIAKHHGKGLPSLRSTTVADEFSEAAAVTGALLAMTRERFLELGGLDESFGWADFEDVDLCLRARQAGGRIWLMRRPGLYHLEGQSMRDGPAQTRRAAWTLINAVRFNERWGPILDGKKAEMPIAAGALA
jgi:GT2 family glycosyltransferase